MGRASGRTATKKVTAKRKTKTSKKK
jgi:hypothetical protein